ncbi:MAG: hypothetical protein FJ390_01490 [Verrucomicrobia bacterium]|nr:hypothetical protein [Verrucomicrobiota bacterium]
MFSLTQREQVVILMLLGIFLLGLGVKQCRAVKAQARGCGLRPADKSHREAMATTNYELRTANWFWQSQSL